MQLTVACVQTNSTADMEQNIAAIAPMVAEAAQAGATLITLPENAFLMRAPPVKQDQPQPEDAAPTSCHSMESHPGIAATQEWARQYEVWILIGSLAVKAECGDKTVNRAVLVSPEGVVTATYDKIHLFDVELPNGEHYYESARFAPGTRGVMAEAAGVMLGLTICYDIRFPHLYRKLAQAGAQILAVPAAFTYTTGIAHWHVLLRARAIETGCFVIAPAQCGIHAGGRRTYGHSLIVSPWGGILAEGTEEETGVTLAVLDLAKVAEVRTRVPSLRLDAEFE